jgi:hypothetical protein
MIQPTDIAAALGLSNVILYTDGARATITADQPVTAEMQAQVQAWYAAGEISNTRSQKTDIVLSRLTDAEYDALTTSTIIGIRRAVDMARSTGVISDTHPAFAPFVAEVDALGIISADRWTDLLAP